MNSLFRQLPSVDVCLGLLSKHTPELYKNTPKAFLCEQINTFLDSIRHNIKNGIIVDRSNLTMEYLYPLLVSFIEEHVKSNFRKVLNGTGVIVHTNMGRSVLAEASLKAIQAVCNSYSNLEMSLETGKRGSRYSHVVDVLCKLTGAESAIVVNNNAAAVLITLDTLCKGKEVIISRGQLVEIGGSFRIPEVMERGGVKLQEVGCTNRVHLQDYEKAITADTAAIMRVHTSNYRVIGFHKDVSIAELAALAHKNHLYLIEDLGSGSLVDFSKYGLPGEPTVQSVVASGAHVVTFSGDKVLGGPQAGIIVGKKDCILKIASNPLNRALRIDKMTLTALESTLYLYLDEALALKRIPTLAMMTIDPMLLTKKAKKLASKLQKYCSTMAKIDIVSGFSQVGGGAFPESGLPTTLVCIHPTICSPELLKTQLLKTDPPLIGRLEDQSFCIDPRTLIGKDFDLALSAVQQAFHILAQ